MSYKLDPTIWTRDTGQRTPCFDRCQLIITWMAYIKEGRYISAIRWSQPRSQGLFPGLGAGREKTVLQV